VHRAGVVDEADPRGVRADLQALHHVLEELFGLFELRRAHTAGAVYDEDQVYAAVSAVGSYCCKKIKIKK